MTEDFRVALQLVDDQIVKVQLPTVHSHPT